MSDPQDTPLSRWSRRKLRARAEPAAAPPEAAPLAPTPPDPEPDAAAPETEAEALERLGLQDPDDLKMGDDFSVFMARAVPEALRRRALRRLWLSNPVLANLDGLNDYDGDFTDSGLAGGVLRTAYTAGKGYLRQITEEGSDGDAAHAASPEPPAEPAQAAGAHAPEVPETPAYAETPAVETAPAAQDSPAPDLPARPRRMRFDFSGQV